MRPSWRWGTLRALFLHCTKRALTVNTVDEKWLRLMIGRADYSLRGFARAVDMDIASVSRTITGKRKIQLPEILRWASVLGVPKEEVLSHVGMPVEVPAPAGMSATVRAARERAPAGGTVSAATGEATFAKAPRSPRAAIVALEVVGDAFMAGWRVLCAPADVTAAPAGEGVGLIRMKDGRVLLRKFRPGFTAGRYDLGPALGMGEREDDVAIVGVIPVVALEGG